MSKLSAPLKALIDAAHARPNTLPASAKIRGVYESLRREAAAKNVGLAAWLSLSVSLDNRIRYCAADGLLTFTDRRDDDDEFRRVAHYPLQSRG